MKTKLVLGSLLALSGMLQAQTWAGSAFSTGNAYRSGNVGIGNVAPAYLLHVSTTGVVPFYVERTSGQINGLKLFFTSNPAVGIAIGAGSSIFQNQAASSDILFMPTQTLGAMIIKSSGRVAVGNTAPGYKFHVTSDDVDMTSNPLNFGSIYEMPTHWGGYFAYTGSNKYGVNAAVCGYDENNTSTTVNISEGVGVFGKAQRTANPSGNTYCTGVKGYALGSAVNVGGVFVGDSYGQVGNKSAEGNAGNNPEGVSVGVWASAKGNNAMAGYFNGGAYSNSYYQAADARLQQDATPIASSLEKIKLLKPVSFKFNSEEHETMNLPQETQLGLNAEDLEQVFPGMVKQVKDLSNRGETAGAMETYKAVNYTNLIPLLIAGIQDQQTQMEAQAKENAALKNLAAIQQQQINELLSRSSNATGINSSNQIDGFGMDQNVPNPFSRETVISYNLPNTTANAYLAVYDLSGKHIASFPLDQKGASSLTITSEKLAAGIYIYSIVADGKVMDSKRMVVAEK